MCFVFVKLQTRKTSANTELLRKPKEQLTVSQQNFRVNDVFKNGSLLNSFFVHFMPSGYVRITFNLINFTKNHFSLFSYSFVDLLAAITHFCTITLTNSLKTVKYILHRDKAKIKTRTE